MLCTVISMQTGGIDHKSLCVILAFPKRCWETIYKTNYPCSLASSYSISHPCWSHLGHSTHSHILPLVLKDYFKHHTEEFPWPGKNKWRTVIKMTSFHYQFVLFRLICPSPPLLFFFLAMPRQLWDLSSPTRDQTHAHSNENRVLITELPENSL